MVLRSSVLSRLRTRHQVDQNAIAPREKCWDGKHNTGKLSPFPLAPDPGAASHGGVDATRLRDAIDNPPAPGPDASTLSASRKWSVETATSTRASRWTFFFFLRLSG